MHEPLRETGDQPGSALAPRVGSLPKHHGHLPSDSWNLTLLDALSGGDDYGSSSDEYSLVLIDLSHGLEVSPLLES